MKHYVNDVVGNTWHTIKWSS